MEKYYNNNETEARIQELTVLQNELSSLQKNASVYRQQRNSNIMFKCNKPQVLSETKKELNSLDNQRKRFSKQDSWSSTSLTTKGTISAHLSDITFNSWCF